MMGFPAELEEQGQALRSEEACGSAGKWMLVCDQLKATLARYMAVSLKLGLEFADLQGYAV